MLSIYDHQTATEVMAQDLPAPLRALIERHLTQATKFALEDLTHIAVIEPHDSEEAIVEGLGFSPFVNPLSGKRYGQKGFEPNWVWLEEHPGWFELIYTVGDSGFAFILYVATGESALSNMCESFAHKR